MLQVQETQTAIAKVLSPFQMAGATSLQGLTDRMIDSYRTETGFNSRIGVEYVGTAGGFERFCAAGSQVDVVLATGANQEVPFIGQCQANGRELIGFQVAVRPKDETRDRPREEPLILYTDPEILRSKPQVAAFIRYYLQHADEAIATFLPNEYESATSEVLADGLRLLDTLTR